MVVIRIIESIKKKNIAINYLLIIVVGLFSLTTCKDDLIEEVEVIELCTDLLMNSTLLNDSFKSIPYKKENEFHFTDSLNNNIILEFIEKNRLFYTSAFKMNCEFDNSKSVNVTANMDTYEMYLGTKSDNLDISFSVRLSASLNCNNNTNVFVHDMLSVTAFPKIGGSSLSRLSVQVNQRENYYFLESNNFNALHASVTLNGKIYHDVYYETEEDNLYYNYEFGLIAFRDRTNKLWVLKNEL